MAFHLEFSVEAERDFGLIFDHLVDSYLGFGESLESALDHAGVRLCDAEPAPRRLGPERSLASWMPGSLRDLDMTVSG